MGICLIIIVKILNQNSAEIRKRQFRRKYGVLTKGLRVKNEVAKKWRVIEIVRWTVTILIMICVRDSYVIQIFALLIISVGMQSLHLKY